MVTDDDRPYCIKTAHLRHLNHIKNGRGCDRNHIAKKIGCEESTRRGLLGECAFVHEFKLVALDGAIRDRGDGGRDFRLHLSMAAGPRWFKTDIKTKSVRKSWPGLMRSGTHLRVPVNECAPKTIYVFGIYLEPTDDAEVLRWDWGQELIKGNQREKFENGNDEWCFVREYGELRELQELKDRLVVRHSLFDE
jgi:hypothetical protein